MEKEYIVPIEEDQCAWNEIFVGEIISEKELIRCKDCKHWMKTCGDDQWSLGDCDVFDKHLVMCEGYCAWAEKKEATE